MSTRSGWILLPLLAVARASAADAPETPTLDAVQKTVTAWVNVRAETSRLATAWAAEQPLAEGTALALEQRAKTAEEKSAELKAKTAEIREELTALENKNRESSEALAQADVRAKALQQKVMALENVLPPRLRAALSLPYKSLHDADLPASDRMQLTLTILNRCLQFNHSVSYGEENLTLGGAAPQIYESIYWGLGRGYALDRKSNKAWVGLSGAQGWHWESLPDGAAGRVEQLIAAYNDKAEPMLAELPAQVQNDATGRTTK